VTARPITIAEIARRSHDGSGAFDRAVREFLDAWQAMPRDRKSAALQGEPEHLGGIYDAYLGALAEHLALSDSLVVPEWCEHPDYFLRSPFFAGGLESLKAILLVESPLAFRRRLIFISADALFRPPRELA
jgi:hypothetical protein